MTNERGPSQEVEVNVEQSPLEACYERLHLLQKVIDQAVDADEDELFRFIDENLAEVNALYPYEGDHIMARGEGIFPQLDVEGNIIGQQRDNDNEGYFGTDMGFVVTESTEKPQIMHKVLITVARHQPVDVVENVHRIFHLYDPDKSSILHMREMEESLGSAWLDEEQDTDNSLETMDNYSKEFIRLIGSTAFRRKKYEQQLKQIDDLLLQADIDTKLRDMEVTVTGNYGYAPHLSSERLEFSLLQLEDIEVTGTCLGLGTVETSALQSKAIRNNKDLLDKQAGLCLVVDPDEATREILKIAEGQILYIPTYNEAFTIAVTLYEEEEDDDDDEYEDEEEDEPEEE